MRGACTGARSKPSSPADQLALTCSAGRDAAANLARFGAHDPGQIPVRLSQSVRAEPSRKLPSELYKSLTWDRGKELTDHRRFTLTTNIEVYFCDPQSPWQRGSNENTNGLLRQYFPKGTDLSVHSQAHLNKVAASTNGHVRPCNLKPQQRDLTPVLHRPVEPAVQRGRLTRVPRLSAQRPEFRRV